MFSWEKKKIFSLYFTPGKKMSVNFTCLHSWKKKLLRWIILVKHVLFFKHQLKS